MQLRVTVLGLVLEDNVFIMHDVRRHTAEQHLVFVHYTALKLNPQCVAVFLSFTAVVWLSSFSRLRNEWPGTSLIFLLGSTL